MHPLAQRIASAAPGDTVHVGPDEPALAEPLRIERPLTLGGGQGAVLRGHARDALLVVTSAGVTISDLRLERSPCPDGAPSWGSAVVVAGQGELHLVRCSLVGAADAWRVEPGATLAPGEAWRHAGLDLRGTGHATVEDCACEENGQAVSVSIYPADDRPNLQVRGLRISGGDTAVAVMADARVQLADLRVEAGVDIALRIDGHSHLQGTAVTVHGARVACWVEGQAQVELSGADLSAVAAALVVRDQARVRLRGGRLACDVAPPSGTRGSCLEAHGVASVRLEALVLEGAAVALWARDGARVQVEGAQLAGAPPDWLAWADLAAVIEVEEGLPGTRAGVGLARVTGAMPAAWDLGTWAETLRERGQGTRPELRRAVVEACRVALAANPTSLPAADRAPLLDLLFQWQELGEATPEAAQRLVPGVEALLPAEVAALAASGDQVYASLSDQTLRAFDAQGQERWKVRCPSSPLLLAGGGLLLTLDARGRTLRAFDADSGTPRGVVTARATVVAIILGPRVELCTNDTDGHPTDRSAWREHWTPPEPETQAEYVQQGPALLPGSWDWVAPDMGGAGPTRPGRVFAPGFGDFPGQAIAMLDGRAVVADADTLRIFGPGATLLAALPLPGVRALAAGAQLWLATGDRRLCSYTLAR